MQLVIDIITAQEDIYKALLDSEEYQSIIGIASEDLGSGMFMTSVKEIIDEGEDVLVVLNSYDTSGYFLEKNKVRLRNITGVLPFKAVFTNPFLKSLNTNERQKTHEEPKPDYIF